MARIQSQKLGNTVGAWTGMPVGARTGAMGTPVGARTGAVGTGAGDGCRTSAVRGPHKTRFTAGATLLMVHVNMSCWSATTPVPAVKPTTTSPTPKCSARLTHRDTRCTPFTDTVNVSPSDATVTDVATLGKRTVVLASSTSKICPPCVIVT
jgi:hypothetical protein